jgi:hypothetical protein
MNIRQSLYKNIKTVFKRSKPATNVTMKLKTAQRKLSPRKKISPTRIVSLEKKVTNTKLRTSAYLKAMCKDARDCLGFGRELDKLYTLFDGYNFKYAIYPLKMLSHGDNGFVVSVPFHNQGYTSYSILKNSMKPNADSLAYEAFVGLNYINKQTRYFPCFLETYALLRYKTNDYLNEMKDKTKIGNIQNLENYFTNTTKLVTINPNHPDWFDLKNACNNQVLNAVLVEYIPHPVLLSEYLKSLDNWKVQFELPILLLQVYAVLNTIKTEFTHYDLHTHNVALYKIPSGNHIRMVYHLENGSKVEFLTRYIVKILDYGRCYCPMVQTYYAALCKEPNCSHPKGEPCGNIQGHTWFVTKNHTPNPTHIAVLDSNRSHDLRLASIVGQSISGMAYSSFHTLLKSVVFESTYGTSERKCDDTRICDVEDMANRLIKYLTMPSYVAQYISSFNPIMLEGTMDIYLNRSKELRFTAYTIRLKSKSKSMSKSKSKSKSKSMLKSKTMKSTSKPATFDTCDIIGNCNTETEFDFKKVVSVDELPSAKVRRMLHLTFEDNGKTSHANMICMRNAVFSNMAYNAFIGLNFINRLCKYYPCFLKTYGLFRIRSDADYKSISDDKPNKLTDWDTKMENVTSDIILSNTSDTLKFNDICNKPEWNVVLMEYIPTAITLETYLDQTKKTPELFHYELPYILFQIYSVLNAIRTEYTHYNLGLSNVLLQEVPDNGYIKMVYHYSSDTKNDYLVEFYSRYIVKIDQYWTNHCSSTNIYYKHACATCPSDANKPCGSDEGHNHFVKTTTKQDNITILRPNRSHDLRLIYFIQQIFKKEQIPGQNEFLEFLDSVNIPKYGSEQKTCKPAICDLETFMNRLQIMLARPDYRDENVNQYVSSNAALTGTLDIYLEGTTEYKFHT